MNPFVTVQDAVAAFADWMEPTPAELDAIERELPAILADAERLDVLVSAVRVPSDVNVRRERRSRRRMLDARRTLANRTPATAAGGEAA
ncbi:DUF6284 family protein [Streptomyces sp. MNP-20]|uniref:DUF6284 family protein n=1 Tax=Streptomyces sp. MNP-20 TaxID=2721165 RepID=UPI0015546EE0|nr:DUF6284 family protein [Streptomyces sp. MNP-20]